MKFQVPPEEQHNPKPGFLDVISIFRDQLIQECRRKSWFGQTCVQDSIQILPLKRRFKSNQNRVNKVEGEKSQRFSTVLHSSKPEE